MSLQTKSSRSATETMKIYSVAVVALLSIRSASAFCHQDKKTFTFCKTPLHAQGSSWLSVGLPAVIGWTLASQIATAALPMNTQVISQDSPFLSSSLVAVLPTRSPEPTYETLDFSMPRYGSTSNGGFGEGVEAYLGKSWSESVTVSGSSEAQKQADAMRKAEEARKARLITQKEAAKQREAEDRIRAAERKKENAARARALFE